MIDWLNDNAGAVQGVAVVVLAVVTTVYAIAAQRQASASAKMAEAARDQAEASARMATEMRRQRLSVSQPVVVSRPLVWRMETSQNNVILKLANVGNGPAIRVRRRISHPSLRLSSKLREHIQEWPLMLVNEERDMSFVLDNPLVRATGELEVSWLDIHGQQFNFSALLKTEETGHIELGDVTFKVEETG